jgi:TP901 family phage tail tape measure protein
LPVVAIGGNALRTAAQFESAMNQVAAVSGATGKQFQDLEKLAKELGETTSFSASQAAEGMSFLAMAGFEVNDILQSMPGVLNLAAAGQMDLAMASDIASNILTGFGKDASEMANAVDVLAKTFTSSNTNLEQLGEAMAYVAPVANSAGLQFEEVSAAVGLLGNAGIQASRAGTSLRGAIASLLSPSGEAQKVIDRLGISALDSSGNLLPLNNIIEQLEKSGASSKDILEIFGKIAGPGISALVDQGSKSLRELTKELENSGGTAQSIADKQLEGLNGALKRLQSAFEGLMISIADSGLLDAATRLIGRLTEVVGKLAERWRKLTPEVQENILLMVGIAAAAGPLIMIFGNLVTVSASLVGTFAKISKGIMTGSATFTRIIPIIGTVITLLIGMYKNSEKFRNSIGPLFNSIGNLGKAFLRLLDSVVSIVPEIEGVNDLFRILGDNFAFLLETLTDIFNGIAELNFGKLLTGILDATIFGQIKRAFDDGKGFGESYAQGIKEGMTNSFSQSEIDKLYAPFQQAPIPFIPGVSALPTPSTPTPKTVTPSSTTKPKGKEEGEEVISINKKQAYSTGLVNTQLLNQVESINKVKSAQSVLNEEFEKANQSLHRKVVLLTENGPLEIEQNRIDQAKIENQERINALNERAQTLLQGVASIAATVTDSIFTALERGQNVFKSLTQGIKQMIVQLIKAIAQAAIFATILSLIPGGSAVGKLLGGIGLKTGKGSFGGNLLGFLGLASGGLVTGPTMALVGEGSGTSLSNPEVVAPLDKLRSMLSNVGTNGNFVASTRLQGSDLLLVVERAERNRNR